MYVNLLIFHNICQITCDVRLTLFLKLLWIFRIEKVLTRTHCKLDAQKTSFKWLNDVSLICSIQPRLLIVVHVRSMFSYFLLSVSACSCIWNKLQGRGLNFETQSIVIIVGSSVKERLKLQKEFDHFFNTNKQIE